MFKWPKKKKKKESPSIVIDTSHECDMYLMYLSQAPMLAKPYFPRSLHSFLVPHNWLQNSFQKCTTPAAFMGPAQALHTAGPSFMGSY
jgi:hypothetical protein